MRIIRRGKKKCIDYKEYIRKCWNCKCKFTYTEKDWFQNTLKSQWMCDLVYCPVCNSSNNIGVYNHKVYKVHYRDITEV